jgi:hypothetical protein
VGAAGSVAEAAGPAEAEAIVDRAITADEAAERIVAFGSALPLALPGRWAAIWARRTGDGCWTRC